jgi:GT2 family glycosyltransferase
LLEKKINNNQIETNLPKIAIIILNWNGWKDTINCINTILKNTCRNYQIIVIDNGSTNNSSEKISEWILSKRISIAKINSNEILTNKSKPSFNKVDEIVLIQNYENLGFAKGNNIGIRYAMNQGFEYVMLLNNDTFVSKNLVSVMLNFMEKNLDIGVSTPCIFYKDSGIVWNFGGKLTFYGSHIFYNSDYVAKNKTGHYIITFITCCAFLIRKEILEKYGLLTEDYFFGEEDYEYSFRMRKNKVKMASLLDARIYHIEGNSSRKLEGKEINYSFVHHLNRLIFMKKYYSEPVWLIWRIFVMLYLFYLLKLSSQYNYSRYNLKTTLSYIRKQLEYSNKLSKVDKESFVKILNEKFL